MANEQQKGKTEPNFPDFSNGKYPLGNRVYRRERITDCPGNETLDVSQPPGRLFENVPGERKKAFLEEILKVQDGDE